ncbi:ternary complex factor MIP1 isoform X3 [Zea mays]|nr:ternary complex factor MIP1 isoform X3 [Zea mays]|eukprot:XP_008643860.1 ternary complex factor MIP1 isoform X3 [Zea mays]
MRSDKLISLCHGMEVEALEKGYTAFAKAVKSFTSSERYKRSESYFEDMYGTDALRSSDKTIVLPMPEAVKAKVKGDISKEAQPGRGAQSTLRKEILELEKHFREQQVVSGALENALGPNAGSVNFSPENPMPKAANELIREIATLELEVKNMEQYLLTLYRKAFEQQAPALSPPDCREASKPSVSSRFGQLRETPVAAKSCKSGGGDAALRTSYPPPAHKKLNDPLADCCTSARSHRAVDSDVLRCQSALSYRGVCSSRVLPSEEDDDSLARALRSCHSQPFSFAEEGEGAGASGGAISLAEYLGTNVADHIPETPNNLSEEMVRCMAGIYCRLADPPLVHHGSSSSPTLSFSSTTSAVSPQYVGDDMWSPSYRRREATTLDSRLINPFHVEGLKEFSGPYNTMVEVPTISRDGRRMKEAEDLLQTYRLVLYRLEAVDLRTMTNEEKIAFWVNVHNALLMHAYLENGVPQNKTSLLAKAACKIAGRSINAAVIQSVVLGCTTHCPGQWLRRTLLYPRTKSKVSKAGHEWRAFAVAQPEPLLRFALCSGSHSDPAVRVYTPKRLFHQLEAAKEEFIRATAGVWKEQKLLLPKLVEAYAKDVRLSPQGLVDMVQRHLPETMRVAVQRCQQGGRASSGKVVVDWVPHNPAFRYLLARDLAFPHLS